MDFNWEFLISALVTLIGLFLAVYNPLKQLNVKLTKIEDKLENLNNTIAGHSDKIKEHEITLVKHEKEIAIHNEQIKELREKQDD